MLTIWPLLVVIAVGVILSLMLFAGPRLFRGTRRVSDAFWCPSRRRYVEVDFQVAAWDGRHVAVDRCSAFDPPTAVSCEKHCLTPPPVKGRRWRRWPPLLPIRPRPASGRQDV